MAGVASEGFCAQCARVPVCWCARLPAPPAARPPNGRRGHAQSRAQTACLVPAQAPPASRAIRVSGWRAQEAGAVCSQRPHGSPHGRQSERGLTQEPLKGQAQVPAAAGMGKGLGRLINLPGHPAHRHTSQSTYCPLPSFRGRRERAT